MPNPPESHQVHLPESLRLQLVDFRRRLWRMKIVESLAAGLIGLLVSFLLVYGLDRLISTPGWARLLILLAGASLFAGFAPYWLHRWVWRSRKQTQIARLIARHYPGLGDRLLGVIELQDQIASEDTLSPRLREAAMLAVATETEKHPLTKALPAPRHVKWAACALLLMLGATAVLTITPQAGINALQRWIFPLSETERYTFTKLESPPSYLAVPFGESFAVTLKLADDTQQKPTHGSGRYGLQPMVNSQLSDNRYAFTFPGQQDPGTIVFKIGDLRHELRVEPMPRPAVEEIWATLTSPDYLKLPPRRINIHTGSLSAVEGSKIRIDLTMSRPIDRSSTYGPIEYAPLEAGDKPTTEPPAKPLEVDGAKASTLGMMVGKNDFDVPFQWKDLHGLQGDAGFRIRVDAVQDAAPTCYIQGIQRMHLMLPEETIDFEVLAEDDFAVQSAGIEWVGELTSPSDTKPAKGDLQLAEGQTGENRLMRPVAFSPDAYGIAPQKIILRGWVMDHFPNRGRIHSEPIVIYVLTRNEHAQILKSRFDRQISELEDLARRELNLLEENQRLEKIDGEELHNDENRQRLEKQKNEENETRQRSKELTERMEELLKDAARNGDIDKETMKKMAEALKSMQELSQQDIPKVQQKLDDASQQSNSNEKSEQDMKQAVEEQKKVVDKMQQAANEANEANRQFEAGTFIKRLKKAASEQLGITFSLYQPMAKKPVAEIIGQTPEEMDPSNLNLLDRNIRQQSNTALDIRWIIEDLAHYYSRTQNEEFKKIYDTMKESNIPVHLEEIQSMMDRRLSYHPAIKSKYWATKLNEWAELLEGANGGGGGGGDGGGGGGDSESEDFEFMLRVMKMIQTQQDLRGRTRALEQLRRNHLQSTAQ